MKIIVMLLTAMAIIGLVAGIVLIAFGKIAVAGIVWAVTALISFAAYGVEKHIKKQIK